MEEWRAIQGFDGYEVSDLGRVRSLDRRVMTKRGLWRLPGKMLRPGLAANGYLTVALGAGNTRLVQHLVAGAFLGPRPDGLLVLHNNGNHTENMLVNIRYGTHSDNNTDITRHGKRKFLSDDIAAIRKMYSSGKTPLEIASFFSVTRRMIYYILSGEQYASI